MTREEASKVIAEAKLKKGITWEALAKKVRRHKC